MAAIGRIMNAMNLAREIRTAAIFTAAAFAGFTSALGATTKWNGGTASDPKLDLDLAEEAALLNPTHIVFGNKKVWNAFVRNPNISKYGLYKDAVGGQFEPNAVAFPRTNRNSPDHLERGNFHALLHAFPWLIEDEYGDLYVSVLAAPNAYDLQRALNEVEFLHEDPIFAESAIEAELSAELDTLWEKSLDPLGWTLADYPTPDLEFGVHYDQYFDGELYLTDEALTLLPEAD